jgi:hypothetical protein
MPRRSTVRTTARKSRRKSKRGLRLAKLLPSVRTRRRWFRRFRRAPGPVRLVVGAAVLFAFALALNFAYQVIRKPTELLFPVSGVLYKTPAETWDAYASIFRRHSTSVMTPELLAALAQVEGSGNPIVRTYWRFSWKRMTEPFEMYRPASSAVGMYQFTDGTFALAKHYCIHDHKVVEDGPWDDFHSCWFNSLYTRVLPSDAVELASAYLHVQIANILERAHVGSATLQQKQELAAIIHLCGAGAGEIYVRRGLRLSADQRCGDHEARVYVARVNAMKRVFTELAAKD